MPAWSFIPLSFFKSRPEGYTCHGDLFLKGSVFLAHFLNFDDCFVRGLHCLALREAHGGNLAMREELSRLILGEIYLYALLNWLLGTTFIALVLVLF